jgi:hypothetical protein
MGLAVKDINGNVKPFNQENIQSFDDNSKSSLGSVLVETLNKDNLIGSSINYLMGDTDTASEGTAWRNDQRNQLSLERGAEIGATYYNKGLGLSIPEDYAQKFFNVRNDKEFEATLSTVQKEIKANEVISRGSGFAQLTSQLISGALDPISYIPVFGVASKIRNASKIGNVAKETLEVGVSAGVTNLASETILSQQQVTRTQDKGLFADNNYLDALIGGAVLGGTLGGGVVALRKQANVTQFEQSLGKELLEPDALFNQVSTFGGSSASAAQTRQTTLDEEGIVGGKVVQGMAKFITKAPIVSQVIDNPVLATLQSPFKSVREASQQIADSGLKIKKGELGIPVAQGGTIESLNKLSNGMAIKANMEANDLFLKYRKKQASVFANFKAEIQDITSPDKNVFTETQFFQEIGKAMRRGDKHENPFIQQSAQAYRREVFDPILKEAQEMGLLPESIDTKTAESYLTRVYDSPKIKSNKNDFINTSFNWLRDVQINNAQVKDNIVKLADTRFALLKSVKKSEKSLSNRQQTLKTSEARVTEGFKFLKDIRDRMPVGESSLVNYNKFYDFNKSVLTELENINNLNVDIANKEISDALPEITSQLEDIFVSKKTALQDKSKFNAMIKKIKTLTKQPEAKETTQGQMFDVPVKELRSGVREFEPRVKYPTLSLFKGEINTNGFFASELKAMDITPKTMPSYFSKTGKYKNIDNISPTDMDILAEALGKQGSKDYLDPDDILDAIRSEFAGKPLFMFDDDVIKKQNYDDVIAFKDELENLGIDFNSQNDNLFDQYKSLKNKQSDIVDFNIDSGGVDLNDLESVSEQINFYDKAETLLPSLKNKIEDAIAKIQKIDPLKRAEIDNRLKSMIDNVNEFEKQIKAQRIKIDKIEKTLAKKQRELGLVQNERGVINKNATRRAKNTTMAFLKKRDESINIRRKLDKEKIEISDLDNEISKVLKNWKGRTSDDFIGDKIDIDEAIKRIQEKDTNIDEQELRITASEIVDQIISTPDGRLGYYNKNSKNNSGFSQNDEYTPSPFKSRAFMIPDELIEDFLISDARLIARRHTASVGAYLNMHKRFNGDVDLMGVKRDIMYEANQMIAKNPEKSKEIQAEADKAIRNIAVLRDRALGRDLLPSDPSSGAMRVSKTLRQLNVITMMGGVVKSSLADLFRAMLAGNNVFKNTAKVFKLTKEAKLKRDEYSRLGVVTELVSNNTFLQLNDIGDAIIPNTKLEKGIQYLSDKFGYVSGMTYWQQAMKQITAMTTEDAIIRNIKDVLNNPTELTDARKALAQNGIDIDTAKDILEQFQKHGEDFKGVNLLNGDKWENKEALKSLLSAIVSETDRIIVTTGYDKSVNINSNEFFKLMAQFKSFFMASTTKVLMRGIQDGATKNNILSFSLMTAMGMLIYASKTIESGRELSDNPAVWLIEGFDRAGIGGIFTEINNTSEKALGLGIRPLVGGTVSSRYQSRSAADSLMGPSFGRLVNTFNLIRGIKEGELTEQDINTIMSLVPYQNTPVATYSGVNSGIKQALGKDN